MIQADLFGIAPDVIDGTEVYRLAGKQLIGSGFRAIQARIQIKRHDDGLWMWAISFYGREGGHGYAVMPKWGKFTDSREDALARATHEIMDTCCNYLKIDEQEQIRKWVMSI